MKSFGISSRKPVGMVVLATFLPTAITPALAVSPVKMHHWRGQIEFSTEGPSPFVLEGTASHLGKFRAYGEITFLPGEEEGLLSGDGIIVFEAANGDLLVGVLSWHHDEEGQGGQLHDVSWRDSVEFSDGTIVSSTGRFEQERPPGVVTIEYLLVATIVGLGIIAGLAR